MKWLHLSDIHYNPERDGRSADQLRKKLPIYLKAQNFHADAIFITGDFRHALYQNDNLSDVAKKAVEYIWDIASSVGVDCSKNIHIVPGNHDLTRSDNLILEHIIKGYDYANGSFSEENLLVLQNRFDFFRHVCLELYGNEVVYNNFFSHVHPYRLVGNYVVLCMNTAIACGLDNDRGNLIIGNYYFYNALEEIKQNHPHKAIIVLAHHALEYLSKTEREQVELLFSDHPVKLYLCGDAHEIWGRRINNWLEITMGCLVQAKGTEIVFCTGNIVEKEIIAYRWDEKFSNWYLYDAFNSHIKGLTESSPKEHLHLTQIALPPDKHNLPKLARNYRIKNQLKSKVLETLKENRLLYISGMSGIGKTSLSISLSESLKNEIQLSGIYFIDASLIMTAKDLYAVDLEMAGRKVNLLGTIKKDNSLYIIDDLQYDIDNIVELFTSECSDSGNSYVIITSQIDSRFAFSRELQCSLSFLTDEKDITDILNLYLPKEKHCPEQLIGEITKKTNGHPLLLNSLRSLIKYDNASWQDILEEELKDFVYHEVEDGKTLMSKLLNRHKVTLEKELAAICWLGSKYISSPLLSKLITKEGIRKLSSRSFIQESANSGVIKVHDIIYDCITGFRYAEEVRKAYNEKFLKSFYTYLGKARSEKTAAYYKSIHLHEGKIISLAQEKDKPGIEWYFYSQAFPNDDFDVFKSFSYTEEECRLWLFDNQAEYIIGTLLELMERKSRNDRSSISYKEAMNGQIKTLKFLLEQLEPEKDLSFDILHHLGKLYRNIDNLDESIKCFEEVLDKKPNSYESKLQLIRIHNRQKKLSPEHLNSEYGELLDAYINGSQISMSVVLAAYNDLYITDKKGEIKKKYFLDEFDYFKKAIHSMAVEAFDQPYSVLAITMKYYTYNYPDKLFLLVDDLPIPATDMINKSNHFDIAQMYKEIGKATMWSEEPRQSNSSSDYFALAEEFYSLLDNSRLNNEYRCVQRAENLILLERYPDAVAFLNDHEYNKSSFWNHRYGQALAGIGGNSRVQALQHLQAAIDLCNQETYLASFNHTMATVLAKTRDSRSKKYYQEALKLCSHNDKYKKQIKTEMELYLTQT